MAWFWKDYIKLDHTAKSSSETPWTLAVLVPCSSDWPWCQWKIFHSHPIWTSPDPFHSFALCPIAGPQREDQCLPCTCPKKIQMVMGVTPQPPSPRGTKQVTSPLLMCLALETLHCLSHSCLDRLKESDILPGMSTGGKAAPGQGSVLQKVMLRVKGHFPLLSLVC